MTGITREQMLAGVTRLNKGDFNARKDSEETTTNVGVGVEAAAGSGGTDVARNTGGSLPPDTTDQQGDEESLETILRAQVTQRRERHRSVKLEADRLRNELSGTDNLLDMLMEDINMLNKLLENNYGNNKGTRRSGRKVQESHKKDRPATRKAGTAKDPG